MEESILVSTKALLGLPKTYTPFDLTIIVGINSAFSTLNQLGIGPSGGVFIEDSTTEWLVFAEPPNVMGMVKSYTALKARMTFDPPTTSFLLSAMKEQIEELEGRLSIFRENVQPRTTTQTVIDPIDGTTTVITEEEVGSW